MQFFMSRLLTTTTLLLSYFLSYGQENICDCAMLNSLDVDSYEQFFQPRTISMKKVGQVSISVLNGTDTTKEMKIYFDAKGQFIKTQNYYRDTVRSQIKYERNHAGQITKEIFSYFYLVKKGTEEVWTITDYKYNQSGKLTEKRDRDFEGKIVNDSRTNFTQYRYNNEGRIIKKINNVYSEDIGGSVSISSTEFTSEYKSTIKTMVDNKLSSTRNETYDSEWRIQKAEDFDYENKLAYSMVYSYDKENRLTKLSVKGGESGVTECAEGIDYENEYLYKDDLLETINYTFDSGNCKLILRYR
jgi:hypothetical protein